jgi:hypothetical protein
VVDGRTRFSLSIEGKEMTKSILEFVGAAVLFYGGLYALLAVIGLAAYVVRRLFRHRKDSTRESPLYRRAGNGMAPLRKFHGPRRDWAMAMLPVLISGTLESEHQASFSVDWAIANHWRTKDAGGLSGSIAAGDVCAWCGK